MFVNLILRIYSDLQWICNSYFFTIFCAGIKERDLMKTPKLFTILRTFSDEEIKRFEKFIVSPYHNSGRNLKPLFKIITKNHPQYPAEKLTETKISKALKIPGKTNLKNTSSQLNVRLSELTKMAKDFIVIENVINNKYEYSKNLAGYYLKNNIYNYCLSELKECDKMLNENGIDELFALERIHLQRILMENHYKANKLENSVKAIRHIPLYSLSFFITNIKVQLYNNFKEYPVNYEFLKRIVDGLNAEELVKLCEDDSSGILNKTLYDYKRCRFYLYERAEDFWDLIEFYKKNFEQISRYLKWQYFLGLMRSGTKLMSTRDFPLFADSLNSLIDFIFERKIFSFGDNEPLEDILFTSIIKIKFGLLTSERIQLFTDKYLPEVNRSRYLQQRSGLYADAFISFKKSDFTKSLSLINLIAGPSLSEKNNLYKLKIAVFYELNYVDDLYYAIDTYNHFLSNNTRIKGKEIKLKFTDVIKKLFTAKHDNQKLHHEEKIQLADECRTSEFHWWFKEKIEEL